MSDTTNKGGDFVTPSDSGDNQTIPADLLGNRVGAVEKLSLNILTVVVVSLGGIIVTIVVGVAAIILDQLHFNNQIYRDGYSLPAQTEVITRTQDVFIKPPPAL